MRPGEVVRMSSASIVYRDDAGKAVLRETYRPLSKKEDFVFLCLGYADHVKDFEADAKLCALLRAAGWTIEPPKQVKR